MGAVGMSYEDFCRLRPSEFSAVAKAYAEAEQAKQRGGWERVRTMVCGYFQSKSRKRIDPRKAMPLPWDNAPKEGKPEAPTMTKAERLAWIESVTKKK